MIKFKSLFDNICELFDKNDYGHTQVVCVYDEKCMLPDHIVGMVSQDKCSQGVLVVYIPIELKRADGDMKTICDTTLKIQSKYNLRSIDYDRFNGKPSVYFDTDDFDVLVKNKELFGKYLTDRFVKMDKDNINITMLRVVEMDAFANEWNTVINRNK